MIYPKIGIRPVIDGRWGGVRESLEVQTMNMAKKAAELISANLRYPDGTPVQCVISNTTIGGGVTKPTEERFLAKFPDGLTFTDLPEDERILNVSYTEGGNGEFTRRSLKADELDEADVDVATKARDARLKEQFGLELDIISSGDGIGTFADETLRIAVVQTFVDFAVHAGCQGQIVVPQFAVVNIITDQHIFPGAVVGVVETAELPEIRHGVIFIRNGEVTVVVDHMAQFFQFRCGRFRDRQSASCNFAAAAFYRRPSG